MSGLVNIPVTYTVNIFQRLITRKWYKIALTMADLIGIAYQRLGD